MVNLKRIQKNLEKPLLVKKTENIFYLTGQQVIAGFVLVTSKTGIYFGDGLEFIPGMKNDTLNNISKYLKPGTELEFEDNFTIRDLEYLKKVAPKIKLKHVQGVMEIFRTVKTKEELAFVRDAVKLTHEVFKEIKKALAEDQWTEVQLARLIRYSGIGLGAEDVSFAPIVAAGVNSAIPHHKPGNSVIKVGEPIVLDFGFKVGSYCSDFTRTVFLKKVPKDFAEIYNHTLAAYDTAFNEVKAGMKGKEVDALARKVLEKKKLSKFFIHSLGHGTGLEVHEHPGVGPYSEGEIHDNMIFSIEPGVYKKGKGGVRIEDLVYLEKGKAKQFSEAPRTLEESIIK